MWSLVLAFVVVGVTTVLLWPRRPVNGPPGPTPVPIIGSVEFFRASTRDEIFDVLLSLPRKFGPVVGFFAGSVYCVYIEGLDLARRAMSHPAANGRAIGYAQRQLSFNKKRGVTAAEGDRWRRNSQFLLSTLDAMLQSGEIETIIYNELERLTQRLKNSDSSVDISTVFRPSYTSLAWQIVTGDTLQLKEILKVTELFQGEMTAFQNKWVNVPLLCYLIPEKNEFSAVIKFRDHVRGLFSKSLQNDGPKRTFIDQFRALHEATDFRKAEQISWCPEKDEDLPMFFFDFINGGCETTSAFFEWFVLYILRHPEQKDLLRREMDALDRPVTTADISSMPRVQAFIAEVFRLSSLTPVGVPHRATEDFDIDGHHVPEDTVLRYAIMADHHSAQLWRDPELFQPSRFLDASGQFHNAGELSHFGIGPRVCPGRRLADAYIFLGVNYLLRNLEIELPQGEPAPPEQITTGLTRNCRPFQVVFKPRQGYTESYECH